MLTGKVISVNGPIVKAAGMRGIRMFDIAEVGADRLIGEVIRLIGDITVIQVYEDNTGLKPGDEVTSSCRPLSVLLGPGLIANIYDGIQRPLVGISEICGHYIKKGIKLSPLDVDKKWKFKPLIEAGGEVKEGDLIGEIPESPLVMHKVLIPPGVSGRLATIVDPGQYTIEDEVYTVEKRRRRLSGKTGRVLAGAQAEAEPAQQETLHPPHDGAESHRHLFPHRQGGDGHHPRRVRDGEDHDPARPGEVVQRGHHRVHRLRRARQRDDRRPDGFPEADRRENGRPLIERTVMIANTSNMPVPAREVSIYTGVTIAEYYRDMGYSVAVMADSTSRWAEALRELASRLGDMPAEEGFPPYLATRLAEFYERAGLVETLSGADGDISIIGAVSPPGGDFSEPVTQHTSRFVRCFWALDKVLADARHYPSISWTDSYTEYLQDIGGVVERAGRPVAFARGGRSWASSSRTTASSRS